MMPKDILFFDVVYDTSFVFFSSYGCFTLFTHDYDL